MSAAPAEQVQAAALELAAAVTLAERLADRLDDLSSPRYKADADELAEVRAELERWRAWCARHEQLLAWARRVGGRVRAAPPRREAGRW